MMVTGPAGRHADPSRIAQPPRSAPREERHISSAPDDQRRGLTLRVARAVPRDAGRGMARLDPADMALAHQASAATGDVDLALLAAAAEDRLGADLAGICREAAMAAVRRVITQVQGGPPDVSRLAITQSDLLAALARHAGRREDDEIA